LAKSQKKKKLHVGRRREHLEGPRKSFKRANAVQEHSRFGGVGWIKVFPKKEKLVLKRTRKKKKKKDGVTQPGRKEKGENEELSRKPVETVQER